MAGAAPPKVAVDADRLGVLNHTLLTVYAVRAAGFVVAGVVLNGGVTARADDVSVATNAEDLRLLTGLPVARIGRVAAGDEAVVGAAVSAALGVIWSGARGGPCPPSASAKAPSRSSVAPRSQSLAAGISRGARG